jgi:hypothetical protein
MLIDRVCVSYLITKHWCWTGFSTFMLEATHVSSSDDNVSGRIDLKLLEASRCQFAKTILAVAGVHQAHTYTNLEDQVSYE